MNSACCGCISQRLHFGGSQRGRMARRNASTARLPRTTSGLQLSASAKVRVAPTSTRTWGASQRTSSALSPKRIDRDAAARALTSSFSGIGNPAYADQAALVTADALAGHADDLVERLAALSGGTYRLFGGGAGGDDSFAKRSCSAAPRSSPTAWCARDVVQQAHRRGWTPASEPMRVTEVSGTLLR